MVEVTHFYEFSMPYRSRLIVSVESGRGGGRFGDNSSSRPLKPRFSEGYILVSSVSSIYPRFHHPETVLRFSSPGTLGNSGLVYSYHIGQFRNPRARCLKMLIAQRYREGGIQLYNVEVHTN